MESATDVVILRPVDLSKANKRIFFTVINRGNNNSAPLFNLRDFLWQGFNEDERGRIVFDGLMPHIAGSRKMFTNFRFAIPGTFSMQHENHLTPGDQFPFTYGVLTDSVTGKRDGILAKCLAAGNCQKVIQTRYRDGVLQRARGFPGWTRPWRRISAGTCEKPASRKWNCAG